MGNIGKPAQSMDLIIIQENAGDKHGDQKQIYKEQFTIPGATRMEKAKNKSGMSNGQTGQRKKETGIHSAKNGLKAMNMERELQNGAIIIKMEKDSIGLNSRKMEK